MEIYTEESKDMIKAGIIGSTGYAGGELARLLLQRDDVEIKWYGSRSYIDQKYASIYQNMFKIVDDKCMDDNMKELADQVDVMIIDLSADFRIKDVEVYEKWYKLTHGSPEYIKEAVYGLPEVNRDKIKNARIIANPGCFPTCSFLSTYPLVKEGLIDPNTIIIDANENIKAYGVASHRHTPEIEEQLSYAAGKPVVISFTPHLVPMNRGILVTAYASLTKEVTWEEVRAAYDKYYKDEYFVRVLDKDVVPQTRWVEGSNFADVNFKIDPRTNRIVMMGAIDNMVKGAAGQAIQNMNLMFGLPENTGLKQIPMFP